MPVKICETEHIGKPIFQLETAAITVRTKFSKVLSAVVALTVVCQLALIVGNLHDQDSFATHEDNFYWMAFAACPGVNRSFGCAEDRCRVGGSISLEITPECGFGRLPSDGIRRKSAYSDEAGHRFRFEAGQSFRFHSGRRSDLKPAISRTDPGSV